MTRKAKSILAWSLALALVLGALSWQAFGDPDQPVDVIQQGRERMEQEKELSRSRLVPRLSAQPSDRPRTVDRGATSATKQRKRSLPEFTPAFSEK